MMTMTDVSLTHSAQDLSEHIAESEIFINYINAKTRVQNSSEVQEKLKHFQNLKIKYEEVQRFGKYHPDFRSITAEVREYKRELDTDTMIAEFKRSEKELHELLSQISLLIANQVSPNIKVPTGNPFFDAESSCSGGCGSGGSCGCG